ncbi:MAG TPA: hypothetical protein VM867_00035 [Xanthobacteraceae bacterium]|nr:hypothetical protein [Xanthobacteraceae bacterium]
MTHIKDYVTKAHECREMAQLETDPLRRAILNWVDHGLTEIARQTAAYGDIHLSQQAQSSPHMKRQNML